MAEQDSLDKQFQKAVSMLEPKNVFMRIGGVAVLNHLGTNHPDRYGWPVYNILRQFSSVVVKTSYPDHLKVHVRRHDPSDDYVGPMDGGDAFIAYSDLYEQLVDTRRRRRKRRNRYRRLIFWIKNLINR